MPVYYLYIFTMLLIGVITMIAFKLPPDRIDPIRELRQFGIGLFTYTYNFREVYNLFIGHKYILETPMTYPHLWYIFSICNYVLLFFFFVAFIRNRALLLKISVAGAMAMVIFRFIAWKYLLTIPGDTLSREYIMEKLPLMQLDTVFTDLFYVCRF